MTVVVPPNESARLAAVDRYEILDTPSDGAFERIAALAARIFDVPIATVTIVDHDRIWFKAAHGIEVQQLPRHPGLCASAILQDTPYVVTDAIKDPRTLENPVVRESLRLRFYAAAPIRTHDGFNLGTVNLIDREPRSLDARQLAILQDLADLVARELELRLEARRTVAAERLQRSRAEQVTDLLQRRLLPQRTATIPGLDLATHYEPASPRLGAGGDFFDIFAFDDASWALTIGDVCGKGPQAAAHTGEIRHMLRALAVVERQPSTILARLNDVLLRQGLDEDVPTERFCTTAFIRVDTRHSPVEMTVCSAGHPLPLVRRADGRVEAVGEPGQLVGVLPDITLSETTVRLAPDELLLLYTDGAVEKRGSEDVGERALVQALATAPLDARAAVHHVRDAVDRLQPARDDVALVLGRVAAA